MEKTVREVSKVGLINSIISRIKRWVISIKINAKYYFMSVSSVVSTRLTKIKESVKDFVSEYEIKGFRIYKVKHLDAETEYDKDTPIVDHLNKGAVHEVKKS